MRDHDQSLKDLVRRTVLEARTPAAQVEDPRCPDCGCPEHVMLQDGVPCCEAEYERATGIP